MNYQIIKDLPKLEEFIEWLPTLKKDECFYFSLLGRNKYLPKDSGISPKLQLKRFVANDKKWIFTKIKQLEVEIGAYMQGDLIVPQEALSLYMMPNPRSHIKAAKQTLIDLANKITAEYDGYNASSIALSNLQKCGNKAIYYDIDFDNVSIDDTRHLITANINEDACTFVKTHSGFHLLVRLDMVQSEYRKRWQPCLTKLSGADVRGTSSMLPVIGCVQGDFVPHFA